MAKKSGKGGKKSSIEKKAAVSDDDKFKELGIKLSKRGREKA
jgi:hypothetical protein